MIRIALGDQLSHASMPLAGMGRTIFTTARRFGPPVRRSMPASGMGTMAVGGLCSENHSVHADKRRGAADAC